MLVQFALHQALDVGAVRRSQPAALDEEIGQRRCIAVGPEGRGRDELSGTDDIRLECQYAEQQILVVVHGGIERLATLRRSVCVSRWLLPTLLRSVANQFRDVSKKRLRAA